MQQSVLFRKTEEYHENKLKMFFQKHYQPKKNSYEVNKEWALHISDSKLNNLRLHLSWSMGINTFEWDRHNLGEQTIIQLLKLGELYGPSYFCPLCLK